MIFTGSAASNFYLGVTAGILAGCIIKKAASIVTTQAILHKCRKAEKTLKKLEPESSF